MHTEKDAENIKTENVEAKTKATLTNIEYEILFKEKSQFDLLNFCADVAKNMGLADEEIPSVVKALTNENRPSVIYLHNAECTGCSEALLRSSSPYIDQIIFDAISLDYHETLMAASGDGAESLLEKAVNNPNGFICLVEGSIPVDFHGTIGGHTMYENCARILPKANIVIAVGTCSAYGGIQTARPNPTGSKGISECFSNLKAPVINLAGCPPNPLNLMGVIVALLQNKDIELDTKGRPKMFYGKTVHMLCERLPHFKAKRFALSFDSEEARLGYCLHKLGCKGPKTFNNCPSALFNSVNWPVKAGHPCVGCSEPDFWDTFTPFYGKN